MSAFFGRYNFDQKPVRQEDLDSVRPLLMPSGPDSEGQFCQDSLGILYRGFHTTMESGWESQPHRSSEGFVVVFDGCLDNREELVQRLGAYLTSEAADNSIVAAAYERWGTDSFSKLIGDWAMSVWDPRDRTVMLAKDFAGIRHLYYAIDNDTFVWSTHLEALVAVAGKDLPLNEEYVAGWLSSYPAVEATPYRGIFSVAPSSFIRVGAGGATTHTYWSFDSQKRIRYRTDSEYEEHFRLLLTQSVQRRLRSHAPVLAELSGGMDSSSIVCIADTVMAAGQADTPRIDTASYFDDSEPNWNERPYVAAVENKRGITGFHLSVTSEELSIWGDSGRGFEATPASNRTLTESARKFAARMESQGNRVLLSGIGGDEVTGGVLTPAPELADLWTRGQLVVLARQLKAWALNQRRPWFHLLFESIQPFLSQNPSRDHERANWIHFHLARSQRRALNGYRSRLQLFGPLPSFQEDILTLDILRRQLGSQSGSVRPIYEKRYPYLDRDLLEFLFAIPREQLVRPGQRRSLMRRALVGIVPEEVLNRRRKAYIARSPMAAINRNSSNLMKLSRDMVCAALQIVDEDKFADAVQRASAGLEFPFVPFMRTLALENWLRGLKSRAVSA